MNSAPRLQFSRADQFFEKLDHVKQELPIWNDELYLEKHRGTLTTQAMAKKMNRKLEYLLRQVEMVWSCIPLDQYPKFEIDDVWKKVLINQFHDVLPGSSINLVYRQTYEEYRECQQTCNNLVEKAAGILFKKKKDSIVLFNVLNFEYSGCIELPSDWNAVRVVETGEILQVRNEKDSGICLINIEPLAFMTIEKAEQDSQIGKVDQNLILENELIRYEFNNHGLLISAFDKSVSKEIMVKENFGNVFSLYLDKPREWDAWDIDIEYENNLIENANCVSIRKFADGPVRSGLIADYTIGKSKISQKILLSGNSKRLDFYTTVDWKEKHRMLRIAFPVNIFSQQASFDIQYGYIKRNTHRDSSWDKAKFEVVGHKYADLSNETYGVALINDCKYGYKVLKNVIDLNLLRSPNYPDPDADMHIHDFTYCFYPHQFDLEQSDVIKEAFSVNQPPLVFKGYTNPGIKFPLDINSETVFLEVLKKAEKENNRIIRLVEQKGKHSNCVIELNEPGIELIETNLMEWEDYGPVKNKIDFSPYEIKTFRVIKKDKC